MTHIERTLIFLFVDNVLLHKWWWCHNLPERSFFVKGRQFHICSRCTGIIIGYLFSIFLLPFSFQFSRIFLFAIILMILDGGTQYLGWRESNNLLRFFTGLGFGLSLFPFIIFIIGGAINAGI